MAVSAGNASCIPDAPIRKEFCEYLVHFNSEERQPWWRLSFFDTKEKKERSFALLIGVSRYEHLGNLDPAAVDVRKLKSFLIDNQHFDEVVILENKAFTSKTLNYFLQDYFFFRARNYKSRFLFAFSGHGANTEDDPDGPSYLLYDDAESFDDRVNAIDLGQLRASLQAVSRRAFHTLVLINSCYGGTFLDRSFGDDIPSYVNRPGAMAITAGRAGELVYSLASIGPGSVFFETLIRAVETGRADVFPKNEGGEQGNGIVTFEELVGDLTASIGATDRTLQAPVYGSIEPRARSGGGAFFFIAPSTGSKGSGEETNETGDETSFGTSLLYEDEDFITFWDKGAYE